MITRTATNHASRLREWRGWEYNLYVAINTRHIIISVFAAVIFGMLSLLWGQNYWLDTNPPLCSARLLLEGKDPYGGCYTDYGGKPAAQYPLTTILAFVPLAIFPGNIGSSIAWGLVNGLLVYGILNNGEYWHFLLFASAPYAFAFIYHQLSPLITAIILLPSLLPLALLKPQIGLPVILTNLTMRRILVCLGFLILTFIIYPAWPWTWWERSSSYDGLIPIAILPFGPLMILSLLKWKSKNSIFLFLMACVPQRSLYDLTGLVLIAGGFYKTLALVILTWIPVISIISLPGSPKNEVYLALLFVYLPLLAMQLMVTDKRTAPG